MRICFLSMIHTIHDSVQVIILNSRTKRRDTNRRLTNAYYSLSISDAHVLMHTKLSGIADFMHTLQDTRSDRPYWIIRRARLRRSRHVQQQHLRPRFSFKPPRRSRRDSGASLTGTKCTSSNLNGSDCAGAPFVCSFWALMSCWDKDAID